MSERDELRGVVNRADWTARAEAITDALLAAGYRKVEPCPTCSGPIRETVNMRCQTCGRDFMEDA